MVGPNSIISPCTLHSDSGTLFMNSIRSADSAGVDPVIDTLIDWAEGEGKLGGHCPRDDHIVVEPLNGGQVQVKGASDGD